MLGHTMWPWTGTIVRMPTAGVILTQISFLLLLSLSLDAGSASNRHSRHVSQRVEGKALSRTRREPNPSGSELLHFKENKYKPKFKDCANLQPTVEEEADRGTPVVQIRATDDDAIEDPDSEAARIEYSIVSTHKKFKIDPKTGWLSTNTVFDRDEPSRQKEAHVTVKATDHGRPPLEDVCTIKVKVTDINDNDPLFDNAQYDVKVPQDTKIGSPIMRVSATDVDEGINQQITYQLIRDSRNPEDIEYFNWNEKTGWVSLAKTLDKPKNYVFLLTAKAKDGGIPQKGSKGWSEIDVTIEVKESSNKPPRFKDSPGHEIQLSEGHLDFKNPIASYTAESQLPGKPDVFFTLINGRTEQTNKDGTFKASQDGNRVILTLTKPLEYEKVDQYTLTLRVTNAVDLASEAQLFIKVKDENNKSPVFTNIESGSVLENEPPGTTVMRVSAVDGDGTWPNKQVKYKLDPKFPEILEKFEINSELGIIKTKVKFDREEKEYYAVTVIAEDGAPSSLLSNGKPNQTPNKFRIVIKDKNDNSPYFPQSHYKAEVPEDADVGSKVIEVKAKDLDTEASTTTYSITNGNLQTKFRIEPQTGFIYVNKPLDYEEIKEYPLTIRAQDGQFSNTTKVTIKIQNRNDMKPRFLQKEYETRQKEEEVNSSPILQVTAHDPDIPDPNKPQNITYFLDKTNDLSSHFSIDPDTGALRIVKPLDRDRPDGYPEWNIYVFAKDSFTDETGEVGPQLENFVQVKVILTDINDNAPILNMPEGLVWYENQKPGRVGELLAEDYDTEKNGPPFKFYLAKDIQPDFKSKFAVREGAGGRYYLDTLREFDRETQKVYQIPIRIEDNKGLGATSILTLIIGDVNDNPMKPGASSILVYNYEGKAPDTDIGRVYVDDPDDWDLPDKKFRFKDPSKFQYFRVSPYTGMITMLEGLPLEGDTREFFMEFLVEDETHGQTGTRAVEANVTVTVQKIPEIAVKRSGSIRLSGSCESLVSSGKRGKLQALLKAYLNATEVEVFTLLESGESEGRSSCDIRFAAHGSPYYHPEKMEVSVARRKTDLERQLSVDILMVHIDKCLYEGESCDGSCYNELVIEPQPTLVYTNTSSFVGVTAEVVAECGCPASYKPRSCSSNPCMNGGECKNTMRGYKCICPDSVQFGPNCEHLAASFRQGWSTHPGVEACENTTISFFFTTKKSEGLLLYQGPSPNTVVENVTDFFALELQEGKLRYYLNLGSQTFEDGLDKGVADDQEHYVIVRWSNESVSLLLDPPEVPGGLHCATDIRQCQLQSGRPRGNKQFLNSNGPLQVGGLYFGADRLGDLAANLGLQRHELPSGESFAGCIKNLTVAQGNRKRLYSLGTPSDFSDDDSFKGGCDLEFAAAVVALNMNLNFLIAILCVLTIILTAVIVMAMYRRRRTLYSDKDIDCDIRENIINYEDEGGGEGDQTGYDLSVLRMMTSGLENGGPIIPMEEKPPQPSPIGMGGGGPAPDIATFLDQSKDRVDDDPISCPHDDLRHYAYEGDGNSGGSLSSLNSGSEADEDLEFEYLHNFGPRFKKLADMYGHESDSESEGGVENPAFYPPGVPSKPAPSGPPGSESWC